MNSTKFMNSKIYRIFDYIFRLVLLNFLIFITALSFYLFLPEKTPNWLKDTLSFGQMGLLFFPSLVAVFDVIKQYEENKSTSILRPFFQSLKKHYKSSLLMGIGMLIIAILLSNSINVFLQQFHNGLINVIGFFLTVSVILVLFFPVHLPLFGKFFGTAPDRLREAVGDLGFSRFRFDFDDACNRGFCSDYRYCVSVFFSFFRNQFADLSVGKTVT